MKISNFILALSAVHSEIYEQDHFSAFDGNAITRDDIKDLIDEHLKANTEEGLDDFFELFDEKIAESNVITEHDRYIWDDDLRGEYFSRRFEAEKLEHSYRYMENLKCEVAMDISYFSWVLRQLNNFSYIEERRYMQAMSECGRLAKKHFNSWDEFATGFYYDIYNNSGVNRKHYNEALLMKLLFEKESPWQQAAWSHS